MCWPTARSSSPAARSWHWSWKKKATAGLASMMPLTQKATLFIRVNKSMQTFSDLLPKPATPSVLPEILRKQQTALRAVLAETPLPTRKTEAWKYSSKYFLLTDGLAEAFSPIDTIVECDLPGLTCQRFSELNDADATRDRK